MNTLLFGGNNKNIRNIKILMLLKVMLKSFRYVAYSKNHLSEKSNYFHSQLTTGKIRGRILLCSSILMN